jgi:hypothetical protein
MQVATIKVEYIKQGYEARGARSPINKAQNPPKISQ